MKEVVRYSRCFVCGDENPAGLKAKFLYDGEAIHTQVTAEARFEGYRDIYHGGVLSSLLDETMIKAILAQGVYAVTAEMTVKFLVPVRTGDKLNLTGRVTARRGRLYLTRGTAVNGDGTVVATATGKYVEAGPDLRRDLERSIEQV
jgi:uncharacterized protein (TIGR00369 family)